MTAHYTCDLCGDRASVGVRVTNKPLMKIYTNDMDTLAHLCKVCLQCIRENRIRIGPHENDCEGRVER